jgi:predicted dehydrogenase
MGRWHAERWSRLPVEMAGFYDVSPEASAAASAEYGGRAFASLGALIGAADVVDVCTPTPHHRKPVVAAAAAGRDIVCEKPLARHLLDATAMVEACEAAGSRLFVAQVVRFFPRFSRAKAVLDAGEIGQPCVMRSVRGGSPPTSERSWFSDFSQSGGAVMDLGVHDIDFARWCLGDVERVFARGLKSSGTGRHDHALVVLRFCNGAIAHIECSWAYPPGGFHTRFEIAGTRGVIECDSKALPPLSVSLANDGASPPRPQLLSPVADWDDPYYLELEHFLSCVETGDAFLVAPADGLEAVRVALAAIESIRTGRAIALDSYEPAEG